MVKIWHWIVPNAIHQASWKMESSLHTFDHGTDTAYPLVGQHEPLECAACHKV